MFFNHGICVKFFLLIHLQSILGILSTMAVDPSTTIAPVTVKTTILTTTRASVTPTPTKAIIAPIKQITQMPKLKSQLLPKPEAVVATPRPPHEIDVISLTNISMHPYFDFDVPRNVTARVGQTAFLHCRVEQLGDKSVSWIRKRDLHILTAGVLTYTSDERFQVIRPDKSENWTLQIKFAQLRDSGIYECQVNTEPKMSMAFRLNVVEAKAKINGPTDLYVKMGSIVTLTCQISQGPHDLGTIIWYLGSSIIEPVEMHPNDPSLAYPPRIAVDVEWTEGLTSRLKISNARLTDSGNYSCVPTAAESSSVIVHVINGEHPAAMQRGSATRINTIQLVDYKNYNVKLLLILSLTFLLHHIVFMLFVSTTKITTRKIKSASFEQLCLLPTVTVAQQTNKKLENFTKMYDCSCSDCCFFLKKTITDGTKENYLTKKTPNSFIVSSTADNSETVAEAAATSLSSEDIIKKPMTPLQLATFEKIDYDFVTAMEKVYIKSVIFENSDIRIKPTNRIITTKILNSR